MKYPRKVWVKSSKLVQRRTFKHNYRISSIPSSALPISTSIYVIVYRSILCSLTKQYCNVSGLRKKHLDIWFVSENGSPVGFGVAWLEELRAARHAPTFRQQDRHDLLHIFDTVGHVILHVTSSCSALDLF